MAPHTRCPVGPEPCYLDAGIAPLSLFLTHRINAEPIPTSQSVSSRVAHRRMLSTQACLADGAGDATMADPDAAETIHGVAGVRG
jgi:hypothetical protein